MLSELGSDHVAGTKLVPVVWKRDNAAMNDTHTADFDDENPRHEHDSADPIEHLAELDPADAPQAAEEYAANLAADLEAAGAQATDPVQLRADLGDAARDDT